MRNDLWQPRRRGILAFLFGSALWLSGCDRSQRLEITDLRTPITLKAPRGDATWVVKMFLGLQSELSHAVLVRVGRGASFREIELPAGGLVERRLDWYSSEMDVHFDAPQETTGRVWLTYQFLDLPKKEPRGN